MVFYFGYMIRFYFHGPQPSWDGEEYHGNGERRKEELEKIEKGLKDRKKAELYMFTRIILTTLDGDNAGQKALASMLILWPL